MVVIITSINLFDAHQYAHIIYLTLALFQSWPQKKFELFCYKFETIARGLHISYVFRGEERLV